MKRRRPDPHRAGYGMFVTVMIVAVMSVVGMSMIDVIRVDLLMTQNERKQTVAREIAEGALLEAASQCSSEAGGEYAQAGHEYQQQREASVVRGIAGHLPQPH